MSGKSGTLSRGAGALAREGLNLHPDNRLQKAVIPKAFRMSGTSGTLSCGAGALAREGLNYHPDKRLATKSRHPDGLQAGGI